MAPPPDGAGPDADGSTDSAPDVVLELPESARGELKRPLGAVHEDPEPLLTAADPDRPLIAVGDVVTAHLVGRRRPDVALVDGRTEREAVTDAVRTAIEAEPFPTRATVRNPPGTLTAGLLDALRAAIDRPDATLVAVEGEEDLAALPAVLLAPAGASVVYGQPGEGMVLARVDAATRARARDLLDRFAGDHERAAVLLRG